MKKLVTLILAAAMVICMTACGNSGKKDLETIYAPAEAEMMFVESNDDVSSITVKFEYSKIRKSQDGLYELVGTVIQDDNKDMTANIQLAYRGDGTIFGYCLYTPDGKVQAYHEPERTIEKQNEFIIGIDKTDGNTVYMKDGSKQIIETDKDGIITDMLIYAPDGSEAGEVKLNDHHMISEKITKKQQIKKKKKNIKVSDLLEKDE